MSDKGMQVLMFVGGSAFGIFLGGLAGYLGGRFEEERKWRRLEREGAIRWRRLNELSGYRRSRRRDRWQT